MAKQHHLAIFILSLSIFTALSTLDGKPFVVGDMKGQLGNQFFCVAAAVSLALDNDAEALFPDFNRQNSKTNLALNYKNIFWRLNISQPLEPFQFYYKEPFHAYAKIPYHPNMRISGFFQSEKYFSHHKNEICRLFAPHEDIVNYLNRKYPEIIQHVNSVSIHVRTYFHEKLGNKKNYHLNGVEYVEKAVSLFSEDALFVVFSDDIEWCKKTFKSIPRQMIYIHEKEYHHDFYLMSMCKHNIISNSTFSWWAAYLNQNPNKVVIAPSRWFTTERESKDIVPSDWIVID